MSQNSKTREKISDAEEDSQHKNKQNQMNKWSEHKLMFWLINFRETWERLCDHYLVNRSV